MEKPKKRISDFERGVIAGVLMGEGHFGGDGKQPHLMVKTHVRRKSLLEWLVARIPGAKLYGPYNHGERHYMQLMVRGRPLIDFLFELSRDGRWGEIDSYSHGRLKSMVDRYLSPGDASAF